MAHTAKCVLHLLYLVFLFSACMYLGRAGSGLQNVGLGQARVGLGSGLGAYLVKLGSGFY
jgi:hypothetical protein